MELNRGYGRFVDEREHVPCFRRLSIEQKPLPSASASACRHWGRYQLPICSYPPGLVKVPLCGRDDEEVERRSSIDEPCRQGRDDRFAAGRLGIL